MSTTGSTGGFWIVAPGRFSAYVGWMGKNFGVGRGGGIEVYVSVMDIMDKLEMSSSYKIRRGISKATLDFYASEGIDVPENTEEFEEIDEICGGQYLDLFAAAGVESMLDFAAPPCAAQERRRTMEVRGNAKAKLLREHFKQHRFESFMQL